MWLVGVVVGRYKDILIILVDATALGLAYPGLAYPGLAYPAARGIGAICQL